MTTVGVANGDGVVCYLFTGSVCWVRPVSSAHGLSPTVYSSLLLHVCIISVLCIFKLITLIRLVQPTGVVAFSTSNCLSFKLRDVNITWETVEEELQELNVSFFHRYQPLGQLLDWTNLHLPRT